MVKKRVVHYLNQFFGQVGGEEQAKEGFVVKEGPVGPGMSLQREFGDEAEIIATVICGDDYFAAHPEENAAEGLKLVASYKPDLFFAGPAFAAGRYSVACGAMCKAVGEELGIPVITGMNEEVPGMEMYRKHAFICKTGNHSREMVAVLKNMAKLAFRVISEEEVSNLVTLEKLPKPEEFNYFSRDMLRNEFCEKTVAERSVEKLLQKLKGEPFETEVVPPVFENFEIPSAVKDFSTSEIAFVSDGGLVPKGNPDGMTTRSNLRWGAYKIDELFENYEVIHAGYFNDYVLQSPDRLVPYDVLKDLVSEGKLGKVHDTFYSMPACTTVAKACEDNGAEIADEIIKRGTVDAVILTST
ncbi:glycine/betaine/sarcosine/D-proline family reductase selenoprotein B [Candidatus Contubernalis alkalaceticus]|nr:glycine/betaine/sarcosine/D-proline family reductase selenoprotein B [Candidatus Contubernalis alkalaceticus]